MEMLPTFLLPSLMSFLCVIFCIPVLVKIAKAKNILDIPNKRKLNKNSIPTLGGIAIFFGFTLATLFFHTETSLLSLLGIFIGITIIVSVGVIDDLTNLSPKIRLLFFSFALVSIICLSGLSFCNFHGFFGIEQCPFSLGFLITVFAGIVIINSFNLIDGIDGLASGLAIQISLILGTWFALVGQTYFAIMAFSLAASCIAFFIINVFGNKNKIFMGDTGSLLIGIIIFVLATKFNQHSAIYSGEYAIKSAPAVLIGILAYPLFDVLRVFTLRVIVLKKSPFKPDKNHIHHRLLALGLNHLHTTIAILIANNIFIVGALILQKYLSVFELTGLILAKSIILSTFLELIIFHSKKINPNDEYQNLFIPHSIMATKLINKQN